MAGQIFDRLVQRLGKKSLFIDIDNIPFGGDFRRHIDDALKSSDLLIAMVGPRWAGGEGRRAARQARWRRCLSPILSRQALGQEANELSERGHRYEVQIGLG